MYRLAAKEGSLSVAFSAEMANVERFCRELRAMMQAKGLDRFHFKAQLLLREALNNAVLHGCRSNAALVVRALAGITGGELLLEVTDPGSGFDWEGQSRKAPDDSASSGRGLEIFRNYAAEYHYNTRGNSLMITLKLV